MGNSGTPNSFCHEVSITVPFNSGDIASVVEAAIAVETGDIADERSRASVERRGSRVRVTVEATDLTALRAATTTWTGLLDVATSVGSSTAG